MTKPYSLIFAAVFLLLITLTSFITGLPAIPFGTFHYSSYSSMLLLYLYLRCTEPAWAAGKCQAEHAGSG